MTRAPVRLVVGAAAWMAGLTLLFMVLVGQSTVIDWVAAAAAGLVAASAAAVLIAAGLLRFRPRPAWLVELPSAVARIPVDFVLICAVLARSVVRGRRASGCFVAASDVRTGGDDPEGVAWRAFVTFAATLSPNSYVVDLRPETGNRLAHDLVPRRASERPG